MARESKTRYALLGILSLGPSSGYDIKKTMEHSTDHFWREGDSSIYPILKQLLKEKLIQCKVIDEAGTKSKKIYTITARGKTELTNWLSDETTLISHRNEFLLKIFFGWNVKPKIMINHIENFRERAKSRLAYYSQESAKLGEKKMSKVELYPYLSLRAGINSCEAALKWCNEALWLLKNDKDK